VYLLIQAAEEEAKRKAAAARAGGGAASAGAPTFAAAVLSSKPSCEGPGGSGGADVWGGKGARGGDAGVLDGEKQLQIDKMRLECEQKLADITKEVRGRNSNSKASNGGTWGTHSEKYSVNCPTYVVNACSKLPL
jgi:hypothetical protein